RSLERYRAQGRRRIVWLSRPSSAAAPISCVKSTVAGDGALRCDSLIDVRGFGDDVETKTPRWSAAFSSTFFVVPRAGIEPATRGFSGERVSREVEHLADGGVTGHHGGIRVRAWLAAPVPLD